MRGFHSGCGRGSRAILGSDAPAARAAGDRSGSGRWPLLAVDGSVWPQPLQPSHRVGFAIARALRARFFSAMRGAPASAAIAPTGVVVGSRRTIPTAQLSVTNVQSTLEKSSE